jgi:hypothetical protein
LENKAFNHRNQNLVTNPVISDELGKDREVFTTSGTYPWSLSLHVSSNLSAPNIQLWMFCKIVENEQILAYA